MRNGPNLVSDWAALKDGVAVRSLLQFDARPPPAALVESPDLTVVGAISPAHVAARDVVIHQINSENAVRAGQRAAATAELSNAFFSALAASMMITAPLLLSRIRAAHVLAAPYAAWRDGPAAWLQLYQDYVTNGVSREEELNEHDDYLTMLRLKTLPDNCSSLEYGDRVTVALRDHIPYLTRPFPPADGSLGRWVIQQLPPGLAADGRRLLESLTLAQLVDAMVTAWLPVALTSSLPHTSLILSPACSPLSSTPFLLPVPPLMNSPPAAALAGWDVGVKGMHAEVVAVVHPVAVMVKGDAVATALPLVQCLLHVALCANSAIPVHVIVTICSRVHYPPQSGTILSAWPV